MMQAGSMKALMGASSNLKLVNIPMKVYTEAENRKDTEKMKRAMGYAAELGENAEKDAEKLGEETVKETREARRQQEIEREQAIAKARQKNRSGREQALDGAQKPAAGSAGTAGVADMKAKDSVEISDSGKAAVTEQILSGEVDMFIRNAATITYSSSAKTQPLEQPQAAVMDVRA